LCEAELEVEAGAISWADVMVIGAPEFAPPLRARVGPEGVVMKTERRQRLQLALAATGEGVGELSLRARVVVCPDDPARHCAPLSRRLTTLVEVGPILR
jgi:hypothetical protein